MKHHYPVRALSLLCALAIFMSLLPATLAADAADSTALTNALKNAVVPNTVSPSGIQLNLFDYWVGTQTSTDTNTNYASVKDSGINKDHYLKFNSGGPMSVGANNINQWTGYSGKVFSGIVQDQLSGGYPVLSTGKVYGANSSETVGSQSGWVTSLAYLFDQSQQIDAAAEDGAPTGTIGKKTYWDVDGLLQIDQDGYYYYNASSNNVSTSNDTIGAGKYQSANYAYFDKQTNAFTLYNNWAVTSNGNSGIQGQFFPFTDPKAVFTLNNGALTQSSTQSNNPSVSHYFGMTMTTRFVQRYGGMTTKGGNKPMTFQFSGDDDVWIFIDGILVADLGGIHNQATTTIDFSNGKITINGNEAGTLKEKMSEYYSEEKYPNFWRGDTLSDDTYHTLKLFFLERGGYDSNLAMKFNLAHVPETEGIKVDQFGSRLSGVTFDLYAAKENDTNSSLSERYIIDESKGSQKEGERGLLASGITNSSGRFVLADDETSAAISLNELKNQGINYLILRESGSRKGYRRESNIYLKLTQHGTDILLLNDEDHHWTTGTYAMPKETVYSGPSIKLCDSAGVVTGTADLSSGGTLFAVIMHRLDGVGETQPNNSNRWGVVTGNPLSGWTVNGVTEGGSYLESVLNAAKQHPDNCFVFKLASNGSYMTELNNCPGDIRSYYFWLRDHGGNTVDTAYAITYYYTTAKTIAEATVDNTRWVDDTDFERQFAATIYIPNVKHYLNVQKLDDNNDPVSGVTFALYKQDDLTITGTGWSVNEGKSAYDTVITGTDGKAKFPSEGQVLAEGKYYLVEDRAPVGYKVNATAVRILVDDEHGVMADAGTANDGVAVTVAEGHLVPTMTPFATVDDIDRTLTNITTTRMEAPSSSGWDPKLEKAGQTVNLKLDTESFNKDLPVQTLRYIPVNTENESLSWRTETGWLWFHIEQTPIANDDPDKNLKTNLGNRDLTRLFTGETTVIVTNQRVGTLAVSKTVNNTTTEDLSSNSYEIEITLKDARNDPLSGTFGGLKFGENGEATWTATAGANVKLEDLPIGTTWKVEETETLNSDNWETTVTSTGGTVTGKVASSEIKDTNQNDTVNITNTYVEPDPEDAVVENALNVRKQYAEGSSGYENVVTKFKIQSNTAGAPMPNPAEISITGQGTGSFGTLEFTKAGTYTYTVSEVNGGVNGMTYAETVYTVTFNVVRGTGSDCNKLVATPTYTVVEKPGATSNSYLYTDTTGLLFTNTYNPGSSEEQDKGSLSIKKTVNIVDNSTETPNLDTDTYPIVVTLTNGSSPITGAVTCTDSLGPNHTSVTFDSDGKATLSLKHSQTITLTGLPVGTTWTVCEGTLTNAERWDTKYKVNNVDVASASGNISAANEVDSVDITNTYTPNGGEIVPGGTGALSISKEIGEGIAATTEFDFTVAVSGASGNYSATLNGADTTVTFENGSAAVKKLKGGDTLVIKGLPAGASYTVTEQNADKYNVTYDPAAPDKIVKDETVTCHVTNELKGGGGEEDPKPGTGSLRITKTVDNKTTEDLSGKSYAIEIVLKDAAGNPLNNTFSGCAFVNGKYTWSATDGATLTLTGLPVGTQWTVTEIESLDPEHWSTTVDGVTGTSATGTISEGITSTVTIVNTYKSSGGDDGPGPGPGPGPNPGGDDGGDDGGTPALNRRDHYAYIIGYPDGDVHPQGNITRAEVATIFFRLLRDPVRTQYWSQTNDYSDVAFNKWYNNAISTLTNMGIICGYPDGSFRPDAPITRAELTKIAASFFSDPRVAATYDGRFSDVQGAEWYISYLMTAIEEGLIEGYPDGSFRPDRPITRAETCTIVNRTLGRKPDKDHLLPESVMINWPDNLDRNVWYYAQMQEATNSHDYRWTSVYSEVCEQWTAKLIERDWAALERTWSHANSAPGGEVMQ